MARSSIKKLSLSEHIFAENVRCIIVMVQANFNTQISAGKQKVTLFGAWLSWLCDALDASIFAYVISFLVKDFAVTLPDVINIVSYFLIATVIGGVILGMISDRFGRKRAILLSVAIYGIFNFLCGTADNILQMSIYRFMVGLAVGGLWGPAAALISEIWEAKNRGKAIAFMQTGFAGGMLLAALLATMYLSQLGWRYMFYITTIPAAFAFVVVLFFVKESPIWLQSREIKKEAEQKLEITECFRGANLKTTLLGLSVSICGMFGFWVLSTFLPTYLNTVLKMNVGASAAYLIWNGVGAVAGYIAFGFLCDKYGRRIVFSLYFLALAVIVPLITYTTEVYGATYLIPLFILLGFFTGYFSGYGAWYSELFGTSIRATAAGLCFNGGRAAIFIAPPLVAKYLIPQFGFSMGMASVSVAYLLAAILVFTLQETKGTVLHAEG